MSNASSGREPWLVRGVSSHCCIYDGMENHIRSPRKHGIVSKVRYFLWKCRDIFLRIPKKTSWIMQLWEVGRMQIIAVLSQSFSMI